MEEEKNERFLPIGSVVLLKGGKKEVMIMSYCIMPSGKVYSPNGKLEKKGLMFDYGGCLYPEGMIKSDQLFVFNHDQIERVCFKGYVTESYSEISDKLNDNYDKLKKTSIKLNTTQEETII